jgi:hypothetical protein
MKGLFKRHKPEIHPVCENVTGNHPGVGIQDPNPLKLQENDNKLFTWDDSVAKNTYM